jgi:hypothetical protein
MAQERKQPTKTGVATESLVGYSKTEQMTVTTTILGEFEGIRIVEEMVRLAADETYCQRCVVYPPPDAHRVCTRFPCPKASEGGFGAEARRATRAGTAAESLVGYSKTQQMTVTTTILAELDDVTISLAEVQAGEVEYCEKCTRSGDTTVCRPIHCPETKKGPTSPM